MTQPVLPSVQPVFADESSRPRDGWHDRRGELAWTTLLSGGLTPTDTFTAGVAVLESGGFLAPHRHPPAELYYILAGRGEITVDGRTREVAAGTAVFIPGNAEHGVRNPGGAPLRFLYVFAVDRFEDVAYDFG